MNTALWASQNDYLSEKKVFIEQNNTCFASVTWNPKLN